MARARRYRICRGGRLDPARREMPKCATFFAKERILLLTDMPVCCIILLASSKANRTIQYFTAWRSRLAWSRARDWKSRKRQKRFESSNLSFSAEKHRITMWFGAFRMPVLRISCEKPPPVRGGAPAPAGNACQSALHCRLWRPARKAHILR